MEAARQEASPSATGCIFFARIGDFSPTGIMSVNVDGSGLRQLLNWGDTPSVSPDGRCIAFSNGNDESTDLTALDPKTMAHSMKPEFFFSDAGMHRMGRGERPTIFLMNADESDVRKLASASDIGFTRPAWSPDGGRIAFLGTKRRATGVWLVDPDGSGLRRLTQDGHFSSIAWMSPTRLAGVRYSSLNSSEPSRVAVVDAETGKTEVLGVFRPGDLDPAWSPDGSMIVFNRESSIYMMNADGAELRFLGDGMAATWSPDGQWVAFSSRKRGHSGAEVFIVRRDGAEEKCLTDTTSPQEDKIVEDWDPCWVS